MLAILFWPIAILMVLLAIRADLVLGAMKLLQRYQNPEMVWFFDAWPVRAFVRFAIGTIAAAFLFGAVGLTVDAFR